MCGRDAMIVIKKGFYAHFCCLLHALETTSSRRKNFKNIYHFPTYVVSWWLSRLSIRGLMIFFVYSEK